MAPMTMLSSCRASSVQAMVWSRTALAAAKASPERTVPTIASRRLSTTWLSGIDDEAEHRDRPKAHDQPVRVGRRGQVEGGHDPLLVRSQEKQHQDGGPEQPVQHDEQPEPDMGEGESGGIGAGHSIGLQL